MSETEILKERIETLERQVKALMEVLCPKAPRTNAEIYAEVKELVARLGPDGAAVEINRRNSIRKAG